MGGEEKGKGEGEGGGGREGRECPPPPGKILATGLHGMPQQNKVNVKPDTYSSIITQTVFTCDQKSKQSHWLALRAHTCSVIITVDFLSFSAPFVSAE